MSNEELEKYLMSYGDLVFVKVEGDGYHYNLTIVSDIFINKSKVARQQMIYARLNEAITSGKLHAVVMNTFTIPEWEKQISG